MKEWGREEVSTDTIEVNWEFEKVEMRKRTVCSFIPLNFDGKFHCCILKMMTNLHNKMLCTGVSEPMFPAQTSMHTCVLADGSSFCSYVK